LNYSLEIAFNGAAFHGFQRQKSSYSVQEEVESALSKLIKEPIVVTGCGRTDTGVHALSFFLNFKCTVDLHDLNFLYKINQVLSKDVACLAVWEVPEKFNARFAAIDRTYVYQVNMIKNPFLQQQSLFLKTAPNFELMNEAAVYLIGNQNFECFSKVHTEVANFMCTISQAEWSEEGAKAHFTITANRFLRNMVRAIVGTLLEIGYEKQKPKDILKIIESRDRSQAGKSVAANGLFLKSIRYHQEDWNRIY